MSDPREARLEELVAERTASLAADRERVNQFFSVLASLHRPENIDRALDLGLHFCQQLGYHTAMLSLVEPEARVVRAARAVGELREIVGRTVRDLDGPDILAVAVRERRTQVVADATADPRCDPAAAAAAGVRGLAVVPLQSGDEVLGTLQVATREPLEPSAERLRALEALAGEVALALSGLRHVARVRELNRQLERRNRQLEQLAEDLEEIAAAERQARDALWASQERLRLLLESTGEGIYGIDAEGRCTFINRAAAELFGCRPEEAHGRDMHQLMHHHRPDGTPYPPAECPIFRASHTGEEARVDSEVFWRADGTPFPVEYAAFPIRQGGAIRGAVVTFSDITPRKLFEEELRRKNIWLQEFAASERHAHEALKRAQSQLVQSEKLAALGQLVAGVAHEINNPLAFVSNNMAVLQRDVGVIRDILGLYRELEPVLGERNPELLARIRDMADAIDLDYTLANLGPLMSRSRDGLKRIQQIVKDLRDFARLDESDLHEVDLNAGIASTINIIRSRAKKQQVELVLDLQPLPPVSCYPAKVNQVVLNLVVNALDATPAGGTVTVRTEARPDGVAVQVADTGSGIPKEIAERIFDPFFTTKPPGQGTGLGLSISYQIVQDHGGRIEFDSAPGKGTHFVVRLPLKVPGKKAGSEKADGIPAAAVTR